MNNNRIFDSLPSSLRHRIESFRPHGELDIPVSILKDNKFHAELSTEAPRVPWDVFVNQIFRWEAGEHVALIGPTGQGKTTLAMGLLPLHKYRVVFATKPADKTINSLINRGKYLVLDRWKSIDADQHPRRILWPNASRLDSEKLQKVVFHDALEKIYREKGWTVYVDELWYICNKLGLTEDIKTYLLQARALEISLMIATQRPSWVPLEVYDQSTHLFFFRDNDEVNLKRISGISWRSATLIRQIIANLEFYQFLYVNTRTGKMCRSRAPEANYV